MNNQDILKLTSLLNCRGTIGTTEKIKIIVLCKRCQGVGHHSQNYCNKTSLALSMKNAPKKGIQQEKDVPPKCVNCLGQYTGTFKGLVFKNKSTPTTKFTVVDRIKKSITPVQLV